MTLELALSILSAIGLIVGGYFALGKILVSQFNHGLDQRFQQQEQARQEGRQQSDARLQRFEDNQNRLERELLNLKAEMPREYVRREDYIRSETVVGSKLDALNIKLDSFIERHRVGA